MGEFEKVDLTDKYNIITNNEKFKRELSKWLFNKDFNFLGNVLSHVDNFDNNINIYKEDDLDLQFCCKNKEGKEIIIYLFDDDKNTVDNKYLLVFKKGVDIEYFFLHNDRTGIYISPGVFIYDDEDSKSNSKGKERVLIL